MNIPAPLTNALSRFDAVSRRERVLIAAAILAALLAIWDQTLMQPLNAKKNALSQELLTMQESIDAGTSQMESDPLNMTRAEEAQLKETLRATDGAIAAASADLLPPRQMIEVIHDVLKQHPGVMLVSLKNEPVRPLVAPAAEHAAAPPYVHPVELIIEGNYLDILAYLRNLELLPWKLHWQALELKTLSYPHNRARIELNTISMEKEWLGV